ncbi:hypothetical protein ABIE69_000713 [Rhodobacteraceae bacterium MBR-64]|jgi:hypothetical protein
MPDAKDDDPFAAQPAGVIISAPNGDVMRYDDTGLVMKLSDRVIKDIAQRLPQQGRTPATRAGAPEAALPADIDAWDLRDEGDWITFHARMPGGHDQRRYRWHRGGGAVIADARGPLRALLGIGGPRAALATPGASTWPHHVLAPGDHIGAVGMAGDGRAEPTDRLLPVPERSHEVLLAETLLDADRAAWRAPSLWYVRAETDAPARAADLATGAAAQNLDVAVASFIAAARRLGKEPLIEAVTLDYALEDILDDATAYRDGMIAVLDMVTQVLARHGLARPVFLAHLDCGTPAITQGAALAGQWELSWNHGDHRLVIPAPGYTLEMDRTGRLTDAGRAQKAAMGAAALLALRAGEPFDCPSLSLAERQGKDLRAVFSAESALVIDARDPFGAGPLAGFSLTGVENGARIDAVTIDPADTKSVILHMTDRPEGRAIALAYAAGADPRETDGFSPNAGAVRDGWEQLSVLGPLHRWALPALLPLTGGG